MKYLDLPGITLWAVPRFRRNTRPICEVAPHDACAKTHKADENTAHHTPLIQRQIQTESCLTHTTEP